MPHDLSYDPTSYRTRRWDMSAGVLLYIVLLFGAGSLL